MSAISLILLCAAVAATASGGAALHTARGLRRQLTALRAELDAGCAAAAPADGPTAAAATVPHARPAVRDLSGDGDREGKDDGCCSPDAFSRQIRAAVAAALADERERELAEARAFWAAQEARGSDPGAGALLAGHGTEYDVAPGDFAALGGLGEPMGAPGDPAAGTGERAGAGDGAAETAGSETGEIFIPRQPGPEDGDLDVEADLAPLLDRDAGHGTPYGPHEPYELREAYESREPHAPDASHEPDGPRRDAAVDGEAGVEPEESPDLAAARRRHPSQPDYNLNGEPVAPGATPAPTVTYHERTIERLAVLADAGIPLADVRPGPLGTLDVYLFEDGTTVCLSPGHRATSEALADAVRRGEAPVLMGGSGIAGAYTLTFGYPDGRTAYLLADRVITPL